MSRLTRAATPAPPDQVEHAHRSRRNCRRLAAVVPVALIAVACGGDDDTATSETATTSTTSTTVAAAALDEDTADSTGGSVATTEPIGGIADSTDDTTVDTTSPPSTTAGSIATTTTTTTTTSPATTIAPDGGPCVPGTWELRAQAFFDQVAAMAGGGAAMRHLGGRHLAILGPDGSAEGVREAWSFEVESPDGSLIVTVDATDTGTWAVDGDTITVASQEQTFEATYEVLVGGVRQPLPVTPPNTPDSDAVDGVGTYTCEGDVLTITRTEAGATITNTWDRIAG